MTAENMKKRILLVEDDKFIREHFYGKYECDYNIDVLANIEEFDKYLSAHPQKPDLGVFDIYLEGQNFLKYLSKWSVRKAMKNWTNVVWSERLNFENKQLAMKIGMIDHINKCDEMEAEQIYRAIHGHYRSPVRGFKINNCDKRIYYFNTRTEPLQPKPLQIINCLFEAPGRIASENQISWELFEQKSSNLARDIRNLNNILKPLDGVNVLKVGEDKYFLEIIN